LVVTRRYPDRRLASAPNKASAIIAAFPVFAGVLESLLAFWHRRKANNTRQELLN
jgi:hypothetical protein